MKIESDTQIFRVKFTYVPKDNAQPDKAGVLPKDTTVCIISMYNKNDTVYCTDLVCGVSELNPIDKPNRRIGRKIAFNRAVMQLKDRDLRTALWHQFLKECRI